MPGSRPILSVFTPLYRAAIALRNRSFDSGGRVVTFDRPVISVGNLSTGGTGKTPFTMHLIRMLRDAGHNPCVAMRGYGAPKGKGAESDEAREYLAAFPDLPLIAQPDRTAGLIELFASDEENRISPIILDDGFQHRQIARQLDIVLMDATRSAFDDSLLPAGNLREPVEGLVRASVLALTHATRERAAHLRTQALAINPNLVVCECDHAWTSLLDANAAPHALSTLRTSRVFALCAIGNPAAFLQHASTLTTLVGQAALRDHDPYSDATLNTLAKQVEAANADTLLITNKDWSKLQRVTKWPTCVKRILRPVLMLQFQNGHDQLHNLVLQVASRTIE